MTYNLANLLSTLPSTLAPLVQLSLYTILHKNLFYIFNTFVSPDFKVF